MKIITPKHLRSYIHFDHLMEKIFKRTVTVWGSSGFIWCWATTATTMFSLTDGDIGPFPVIHVPGIGHSLIMRKNNAATLLHTIKGKLSCSHCTLSLKSSCLILFDITQEIFNQNYSIGGFEWISINFSKTAAFSLQTSENNLKPP